MRSILSILICSTVLAAGTAFAASSSNCNPKIHDRVRYRTALQAAVTKNLRAYGIGAAVPGAIVGVWVPGQVSVTTGIGTANLATGQKMSTAMHVRVASITKSFVISVLLQLVDEDKISLDDPLSKFDLGLTIPNASSITLRELGNMTSGIFDYFHAPEISALHIKPTSQYTPQQLIGLALDHKSYFSPGHGWTYSDTNYLILGLVVEKVTGNSLPDEIKNRMIVPLGLSSTVFETINPHMPTPYAHGYGVDSSGKHWTDNTVVVPPSLYWAAGAMVSTMADLKVWVKSFVSGSTNSDETQRDRLTCVSTDVKDQNFGLGVVCSGGWYGYTGGTNGYNSAAYYLPGADATIVVLVNSLRPIPIPGAASAIVRDIAKTACPNHVPFS